MFTEMKLEKINHLKSVDEIYKAALFQGLQVHTRDYQIAEAFIGKHVLIVGGSISGRLRPSASTIMVAPGMDSFVLISLTFPTITPFD